MHREHQVQGVQKSQILRLTLAAASALTVLVSAARAQSGGKVLTQTIPDSVARSAINRAAEKRLSALPAEFYAAPAPGQVGLAAGRTRQFGRQIRLRGGCRDRWGHRC